MRKTLITLAVALAATTAAPTASAAPASLGNTSLASVLTSDGNRFDHNWGDYDIVTEAALAVLAAKPDSPVKVLTQGDTALTAFIPNDRAFRRLWHDVSGRWLFSEKRIFTKLAGKFGIDTIEQVLLYHVVPGATITAADALQADGVALTTAQGGSFTVNVVSTDPPVVKLVDLDPNDRNPRVVRFDINAGNVQIAHGLNRVLRPLDID